MADLALSDATIAAMSPEQRRELIKRLEQPVGDLISPVLIKTRHIRLGLIIAGAAALVPWIVFLAFTLPSDYVVHDWPLTWTGFDLALAALMASTAILGWLRKQLMLLTAVATAVLLICDAWFDIMTAGPETLDVSIASAVFLELPFAALLLTATVRIMRVNAMRFWMLRPGQSLWRLPLLP